ncbi:uncharacterized mitochondrial protein-like protein [Tanacetum coccineum]
MLVQVYVDDIIFGFTKKSMCTEFEECMHKRFQMSSMGELTFFLGLQVKQQPDGIFISQDKYVADLLKKFDFLSIRTTTTPIESNKPLVKDEDSVDVDVHVYRSMIGSLIYLTASRPDIMFAVCACARDSPFGLEAYSDSDYGGASLNKKSTTGAAVDQGKRTRESGDIQDIDDDPLVSLVRESMKEKLADFVTPTKALGEAQEEEIRLNLGGRPKLLSKVLLRSVMQAQNQLIRARDKGGRSKEWQEEQELSEQQLKRKAEVQEAAQFYIEEDWDTIREKLEANT